MRAFLAAVAVVACVGTTGGQVVDFPAAASGASDATSPFLFNETTASGHTWHVSLTQATLHVGAVYLDVAAPISGAGDLTCVLPGTYVAEVLGTPLDGGLPGLDVDLLDPTPQPFPSYGHGTTTPALVGQVWLTGGDINTIPSITPILFVAGTATDDAGANIPFEGSITIGSNRSSPNATNGSNPICKQRIVSPIPTTAMVATTGTLLVRVDARRLFDNVDFGQLEQFSTGYGFSNDPTSTGYTQPSINLYGNLRTTGPYTFTWLQ
jgi:hypothetical protein